VPFNSGMFLYAFDTTDFILFDNSGTILLLSLVSTNLSGLVGRDLVGLSPSLKFSRLSDGLLPPHEPGPVPFFSESGQL